MTEMARARMGGNCASFRCCLWICSDTLVHFGRNSFLVYRTLGNFPSNRPFFSHAHFIFINPTLRDSHDSDARQQGFEKMFLLVQGCSFQHKKPLVKTGKQKPKSALGIKNKISPQIHQRNEPSTQFIITTTSCNCG